MKMFSLSSCVASVASAPVIILMSPDGGVAAKVGLAGLMCGFSALTTGLLHWLTGPYVHALEYAPSTQRLHIRTLSVLCQPVHTDVQLAEVAYPADTLRPQVTFQAAGRYFYIDADAFRDKELLAKLSPPEPLPLK
ncbi:hypothetical protein WJX81_005594 [Elliptochloris bilobata]|uniref:Transmembrane protein 70 n=1 Tax=Elliptochloris bilobata TaxID=381761 RepID=A0AAW1RTU7_9CHLO